MAKGGKGKMKNMKKQVNKFSIMIGLENCDYINVDSKNIALLSVKGLKIESLEYYNPDGRDCYRLQTSYTCDYFELIIRKSGNTGLHTLDEREKNQESFWRLEYADIVDVSIDGMNINVPYIGDNYNECQINKIDKEGNFHIVITEDNYKKGKRG